MTKSAGSKPAFPGKSGAKNAEASTEETPTEAIATAETEAETQTEQVAAAETDEAAKTGTEETAEADAEAAAAKLAEEEAAKLAEEEAAKLAEEVASRTGYVTTGRHRLRNPLTGDIFYPRNSPYRVAKPKKLDGWLKAQITAGVIEKADADAE